MNLDAVKQIDEEIAKLKQTLKRSTDYFLEFSMHLFQNKRKELLQIKANLNDELRIYREHEQDTEEDYQFLKKIEQRIDSSSNREKNQKKVDQALLYIDKNQTTTRRRIDTLANDLLPKLDIQLKVVEQKINSITKKINNKSISEQDRLLIVNQIEKLESEKETLLSPEKEEFETPDFLVEPKEDIPKKIPSREAKMSDSSREPSNSLDWDMPSVVIEPKVEQVSDFAVIGQKKKVASYRIRSYKEANATQIIGSIDIMTGLGFQTRRYCVLDNLNLE